MPIEHVNITEPYIHEPKGASTATAGRVYIANGAGSGVWKNSALNVHGDMIIANNATATVTSAAADSTLNTNTDYVKVTAGWAIGHMDGITFNTDEIVVPDAGGYELHFWANVLVPKNNNFVGLKYVINDTTFSSRKIVNQSTTVSDYISMSGAGIVTPLSASDTIGLYVASSQADSLVLQEAGVLVKLLDAV